MQIELVKFDISKGAENPAHCWIEKVNFDELTDQESSYYEGKKATPMDIVKGLPVSRVLLERDIRTSVNNYMVTVIKSSSGQGKTTLALKTQYGLQKEYTPYQLINCSDRGTLRHIVEYFHARIRLGEKPLILIDNLDGLFVIATEVCPFAQFREIDESVQTLEQMREIMPKNENIQYLLNLKDSIPAIDMTQTDIYILSMRLFKRLKDVNTKNVSDLDAYAMIADWLYNMDASMNLASNINLTDLWTRIENYSIDTISLLMYTAYCGDRDIYSLFVSENLEMILSYLKRTTFSHKLYVDETETAIHVEYVLRASELQNGNQESVSRLNYICRTLPIYETYCSDAIMPKYDMLQPYRMPDDAHKEMPRRNLVIAFHKEFTSLWIKTIQSNYEFDSVSEWIEYWFQVRKCMYECLDKIGVYMYKALAGKRTGSTGTEFDKTRKKMDRMLCSTLSYPKEHRPFEEEVEVPKKFLEVKQAYFNSMQNFLRQVAGLIQRDENDVRLALYNLKQAKAGLPKMHKFFDGMELDEEMASKHTNLCRQESQKYWKFICVVSTFCSMTLLRYLTSIK